MSEGELTWFILCFSMLSLAGVIFAWAIGVDKGVLLTTPPIVAALAVSIVAQLLLPPEPIFIMRSVLCGVVGAGLGIVCVIPAFFGAKHKVALGVMTIGVAGSVGAMSLLLYDRVYDISLTPAKSLDPNFIVEEVATLERQPLRIACFGQHSILASHYDSNWKGQYNGIIAQVSWPNDKRNAETRIVASSPLLYRAFGLAVRDGDVFVSRSGHLAHAANGKIRSAPAGAVTRLKDLDGDGYFEYFDDVVSGLPGSRVVDPMHQNNGIAFDKKGRLYIANGADGGRQLDEHPWGGTVLRTDADYANIEVFAKGLRNPFGICIGPYDGLFVTDNDAEDNPGDELNHVELGHHYGHPYLLPKEKGKVATGFDEPILLTESNFGGVTAAPSALPVEYHHSLFVAELGNDRIMLVNLKKTDGRISVIGTKPFAIIPSPVDIVAADNGDLYVASILKRKIYRIRRQPK